MQGRFADDLPDGVVVSPDEAFRLLSRYSQDNNQRVRKISGGLVEGRITAAELRPGPR